MPNLESLETDYDPTLLFPTGAAIAFGLLFSRGLPPFFCWSLAFVAGFGRVYYWYHYVSDVVAGALVSYTSAFIVGAAIGTVAWYHVACVLPFFVLAMKLTSQKK